MIWLFDSAFEDIVYVLPCKIIVNIPLMPRMKYCRVIPYLYLDSHEQAANDTHQVLPIYSINADVLRVNEPG